jgi:hypothetical protein
MGKAKRGFIKMNPDLYILLPPDMKKKYLKPAPISVIKWSNDDEDDPLQHLIDLAEYWAKGGF